MNSGGNLVEKLLSYDSEFGEVACHEYFNI